MIKLSLSPLTKIILPIAVVLTTGCGEAPQPAEEAVRGMKGFRISNATNHEIRRYPSVVEPARETKLSFEVAGQLKQLDLEVGQRVEQGQVLAELDPVSLELKMKQARSSLNAARADYNTSRSDYERKKDLLKKQFVTQSQYDQAENLFRTTQAKLDSAQRQLQLAQESLGKTQLVAPFKGVISAVEVEGFSQVSPGTTILALYSEGTYEVSFTVPASIVGTLNVGESAEVIFPDLSQDIYKAHIKELGTRATQVSAFPVVVSLDSAPPALRAGINAEVSLSIPLDNGGEGFLLPISAIYFGASHRFDGEYKSEKALNQGSVFVYDANTSTVIKRDVKVGGILANQLTVISGLEDGQIVAAAGVSYLRDGQKVKLLPMTEQR